MFVAAVLSYRMALEGGVVSVWLPSGFTLGLLLQTSRRAWAPILIGAYAGNLAADLMPLGIGWLSFAGPAANVIEALVAASVVRRLLGADDVLVSVRGVGMFLLGGVLVSNAVTAVLGGGVLWLAFPRPFWMQWSTWWLGDGLGMLIVAPAVLAVARWMKSAADELPGSREVLEATLLLGTVLVLVFLSFRRPGDLNPFLAVLVFPVVILSALRLKSAAHPLTAIAGLTALWFSAHGQGPLVEAGLPPLAQAVQVFSFLALLSVSTLVLVAAELEREAAHTEGARLQAQLLQAQKMEAIGRLTGGVAHDFNNMLTAILAHADLAGELADEDERLDEHLTGIQEAAARSAALTRQLLGFARQQLANPRILDLNDATEELLPLLRQLIREDIALEWKPGADLCRVFLDPVQLQQILMNLCTNARDAIAEGGSILIETRRVTFDRSYCETHPGSVEGEFAMLAVTDDGVGMDQAALSKAFEPFYTTKALGQGTGLGLATVFGVVKQNDGFLNAYSEPGLGTSVKIYLPSQAAGVVPTGTRPREVEERASDATVLVVDDELAILRVVAKGLRRAGYSVLTAASPEEALAHGASVGIDILVTDVVMPEMDGRTLATRLMEQHPNLTILYTSGYTANVIARRGIIEEGVNFIGKPYTIDELTTKVGSLLGTPTRA